MPALATALFLSTGLVAAAEPAPAQGKEQAQKQEQVYGAQLMTQQERTELRAKMFAAKTVEEREQIRNENHKAMQERAKTRGVTLPEVPLRGSGMGMGGGMGGGMRGGMGPGGATGR